MTRSLGHIDDHPSTKDFESLMLTGVRFFPVGSESDGVRTYAPPVEDQNGYSSCVGEALANAIYIRRNVLGLDVFRPSSLKIYWDARIADGLIEADAGSRPRVALQEIYDKGYCRESAWPREHGPFEAPDWAAHQEGVDRNRIRFARIVYEGSDRVYEVQRALVSKMPVCLSLRVDRSFQHYDGTKIWPGPTEVIGSHYVCATHYDAEGLWIQNSWGYDWGIGGFGRIPWTVIANPETTRDVWLLDYIPEDPR